MEDKSKNLKLDFYNASKITGIGTLGLYYSKKGKIKRFASSIKCHSQYWDNENREVKKGGITDADKAIIDSLFNRLQKIITDHQYKYNELPDVSLLTQHLDKPLDVSENIHELYQDFLNDYVKHLSSAKQRLFNQVGDYLLEVDKRNKYNLNLHNFNYTFIQKFKDYLLNERGNQNSSVNNRIVDVITFVNWLNKKEIKHSIKTELWERLDDNSVEDYTCLERKELTAILKFDPAAHTKNKAEIKRLQKTKDIIVFLSHTGVRVSDMKTIKKHNVIDNCINFLPNKTKRKKIRAIIPITKPVREILERYDYKLPVYSRNYTNTNIRSFCAQIKELQVMVNHTKLDNNEPVTELVPKYSILDTHAIGRKTFINLCIEKKVQLTTIAGMTGHVKIDTIMRHYADKHANKQTALAEVFEM